VTTFVPLSTLLTFNAGGCHVGVATGGKFLSPLQQVSNSGEDVFSPKISSNSPQSLSAAALSPTLKFSAEPLTLEEDGGFALVQELDSHLANMYSAFLQGGTCIPFFFKLCLAASDTEATIWQRRSDFPTKMNGKDWRIDLYVPVDRAMSNSDRKSISIINLSPSTITSMYSYSPESTSHTTIQKALGIFFQKNWGKISIIDYQQGRSGFCPI